MLFLSKLCLLLAFAFSLVSGAALSKRQANLAATESYIESIYASDFPLKSTKTANTIIVDVVEHIAWIPYSEVVSTVCPYTVSQFEQWATEFSEAIVDIEIAFHLYPSAAQLAQDIVYVEDFIVNAVQFIQAHSTYYKKCPGSVSAPP